MTIRQQETITMLRKELLAFHDLETATSALLAVAWRQDCKCKFMDVYAKLRDALDRVEAARKRPEGE